MKGVSKTQTSKTETSKTQTLKMLSVLFYTAMEEKKLKELATIIEYKRTKLLN